MPRAESCGRSGGTIGSCMVIRGTAVAALMEVPAVPPSVAPPPVPMDTRVHFVFIPKLVLYLFTFIAWFRALLWLGVWAIGGNVSLTVAGETL